MTWEQRFLYRGGRVIKVVVLDVYTTFQLESMFAIHGSMPNAHYTYNNLRIFIVFLIRLHYDCYLFGQTYAVSAVK